MNTHEIIQSPRIIALIARTAKRSTWTWRRHVLTNSLLAGLLLCVVSGNTHAGSVNWWVVNTANEPVIVSIWRTTRTLQPRERAPFEYQMYSKLWVNVRKMDGTLTYSKRHTFDWVPNNHACVVNPDFTFTDLGKDTNGKLVEEILKRIAKLATS